MEYGLWINGRWQAGSGTVDVENPATGKTVAQVATAGEQDIDDNFARAVRKGSFRADMKQCYKAYDHSLRYDPDNAMVLNNYAYFLSLEGRDLEKALTMSSRAIALTDNNQIGRAHV